MTITPTAIPDVKLVTPRKFGDARGFFMETYQRSKFASGGIACEFVQDNHAMSAAPFTLRGLHFQKPPYAQAKLVRVVRGSVLDVAVDIRRGSPTFGRWVGELLSAANAAQLFVPVGFAHGYVTLEPDTEVLYKVDNVYAPTHEGGLLWNDPAAGIDWRLSGHDPILNDRDRKLPRLSELELCFNYVS